MVEDDAGDSTCVLVTPGGYRVEGLGVAGMAELIRRL